MLKLGKSVLLLAAVIAGLGVLVNTLPWLQWLQHRTPMPPGTEARWLGWALVAGACLLARHALDGWQRARHARELKATRAGEAFEARGGTRWFLLAVPLCVLFGWGSHAAFQKGQLGTAALMFGMLVLFALLCWQLALQVLRPGPMLRMDAHGIDHALYGPIPWDDVIGIQLQSIRVRYSTQHTLMLGVRGARRYLRNAPSLTRWQQGRRIGGDATLAALPIALNVLDKDANLIHQSALALRQRHDAPFLEHWHHRMEQREAEALLRMQDLERESDRILKEMRALPADASPERMAAFDVRLRQHHARHDAALPELKVAMDTHARRTKQDIRGMRILLVVMVGLALLSLALRLLR